MKIPFLCMLSAFIASSALGEESWPRFRGNDGTGNSEAEAPTNLEKESLLWSTSLPGPGSSSPAIWEEHLFITGEDRDKHTVNLSCLDSKTGKILWTKSMEAGEYHLHQFNNTAASTPAVNKDAVVVSWFDGGKKVAMLSAYDHSGKSLWNYEIGPHKSQHGLNIDPAIHDDRVVICNLHMDGGFVGAISMKTGKELWKTNYPGDKTSYVTPLIRAVERPDGPGFEVIIASTSAGVVGLDLKDGREQWSVPGSMKERCIVSPIDVLAGSGSDDSLIAVGCKNGVYFTVRPPALKGKEMSAPEVAWEMKGNTPYVPTPVSNGQTVFALSDGGVLTALDALSGKTVWQERMKANFYASPLLAGGRLYALSREGEMIVADVRKSYQEISRTSLNPGPESKWSDATPAIVDGRIYVRLGSRLDCYGSK